LFDFPEPAPTEIVPGLFQGGTEDWDVIHYPTRDILKDSSFPFDTFVTLYASANPAPWGVFEMRFGFMDGILSATDVARVVNLAKDTHEAWLRGERVLVRCQAGMNRSGLVVALTLMLMGLSPSNAVSLIRARRGGACLCNEHFVRFLVEDAPSLLGLR
jgi:protein-tyrosine phosphatase